MKIIYFNPATVGHRFTPFDALKGSTFFRRTNFDALRLAHLSRDHEFHYYDEQIEEPPKVKPDLVVMNVPLNLAGYIKPAFKEKWPQTVTTVLCGLYPTLFPDDAKDFASTVIPGDVTQSWPKLIADLAANRTARVYRRSTEISFKTDRAYEGRSGFTSAFAQVRTAFGCHCHPRQADYCPERALYPESVQWPVEDVVEEIKGIRRKTIYILDDDFLCDPDRAIRILERCWAFKKRWIFQTGPGIFNLPGILPRLQDNGVRIIYIKEDWLGNDLTRKILEKSFVKRIEHQINTIHGHRIAVGAKIRLGFEGEDAVFYKALPKFLININLDFIEISTQTPLPRTPTHEQYEKSHRIAPDLALFDLWSPVVKIDSLSHQDLYSGMERTRDYFYSWDSIIKRNALVSQKLGIYNSAFYLLLPNLSYRNNFLEKVGFPP
jgi:radical SAM superfamily enzyme YgiQ (UPF0313 family)